ncbi:MAG TPA: hypothetical protein DCE47_19405 [Planctomycetaceae bacterium]|nr:hypothetical protein [Planctomycetaceae bacterium]
MSTQRLAEAIEKLRGSYGGPEAEFAARPLRRWSTLVDVVAGEPKAKIPDSPRVPLDQPEPLLDLPVEALQEALKVTGRDQRRAGALQALANWWPGDDADESWCEDHERRRMELTAIRGVGHELVDRILLLVLGLPAMPLSRAALRVGCRHGWSGLESEYDEWQHLFRRAAELADSTLPEAWWLINRVGRSHCGSRPRCDGCPLEPLLPEGGPYEPE